MENNYYSTDQREGKNLLCTKCNVVSHMRKIPYGKKPNEFSWWCCNCEDKISQSSIMEIKDITSHNLNKTQNHSQQCLNGEKLVEGRDESQLYPTQTIETPDKDLVDNSRTTPADTRKGYDKAKEGLEKIKESKKGFGRSYGY